MKRMTLLTRASAGSPLVDSEEPLINSSPWLAYVPITSTS